VTAGAVSSGAPTLTQRADSGRAAREQRPQRRSHNPKNELRGPLPLFKIAELERADASRLGLSYDDITGTVPTPGFEHLRRSGVVGHHFVSYAADSPTIVLPPGTVAVLSRDHSTEFLLLQRLSLRRGCVACLLWISTVRPCLAHCCGGSDAILLRRCGECDI
jgi:hypothetical protein